MKLPDIEHSSIAVVGLGYVGLPLLLEIARWRKSIDSQGMVIGYDIKGGRIAELDANIDSTGEVDSASLEEIRSHSKFSSDSKVLEEASVFIITVPTPIDSSKKPDLKPLRNASKIVGEIIRGSKPNRKEKPIVVYESTVYPGLTEEVCCKILEKETGTELNEGFGVGYSPERVVPGDKERTITKITKVTSGSSQEIATWVDGFYSSFIKAGTVVASSILAAESSKILENTQRDVNIALINEFAMIYSKMGLSANEVIDLASTKWNFMGVKPGLVGGHCIGVDPYYMIHKSIELGSNPELVAAARRINESVSSFIANSVVLRLGRLGVASAKGRVLVLGVTFKENCPDVRSTKVVDVVKYLEESRLEVDIVDPVADRVEVKELYSLDVSGRIEAQKQYDAVLLLVPHNEFMEMSLTDWKALLTEEGFVLDLKRSLPREPGFSVHVI